MITFKLLQQSQIDIAVSMMRDFYAIDDYPFDVANTEKLLKQFIQDENLGLIWLIFSKTNIVGYVILTFVFSFEYGGKIGFIDELFISEEYRGQGIGEKTIQFAQSEAKKLFLKLLYLEVEEHNKKAQKLYELKGFSFSKRKFMSCKIIK